MLQSWTKRIENFVLHMVFCTRWDEIYPSPSHTTLNNFGLRGTQKIKLQFNIVLGWENEGGVDKNYCFGNLEPMSLLWIKHALDNFLNCVVQDRPLSKIPSYSLFVSPKSCVNIVSIFSWDLLWSQEKIKAMLLQHFGWTNKEYYGIFESGLLYS